MLDQQEQLLAGKRLREEKYQAKRKVEPESRKKQASLAQSLPELPSRPDRQDQEKASEPVEEMPQDESLRERVLNRQKAESRTAKNNNQAADKLEEKLFNPAKTGTSSLLKFAWLNLIDSFGLTLIYINMHVFLRWVVGDKFFCKLGEEWLPKQTEGEAAEVMSKPIGIIEIIGLLLLDVLAITIVGGALAMIVMIIGWVAHPLQAIMDLGWNGVQALVNLFKDLL